jgi:hypothetical protein
MNPVLDIETASAYQAVTRQNPRRDGDLLPRLSRPDTMQACREGAHSSYSVDLLALVAGTEK